MGVNTDWDKFYKGCETEPIPFPRYQFDSVRKDILTEAALSGDSSIHPAITQLSKNGLDFSCDLSSGTLSYLYDHKHQGVAIVPGAFYVELSLASVMTSVKPKMPLSSLQLSISFHTPCVLSKNIPGMRVSLNAEGHSFQFKVHSLSVNYASGKVESTQERLPEESYISLNCVFKRCQSVVSSEEFYKNLSLGGFQYGPIFKNKGNDYYGKELGEIYSIVTVPDEILPQLHDYYIHPVVLDYLMQLVPVTGAYNFLGRPGFPSQIGSLTVFEPLQKEMVVYLRATHMGNEKLTICGCFANKDGRVLVELKNVIIIYLGSHSRVVEEYFYHNSYGIISEHSNFSTPKSMVFSDQLGISTGLQQYLDPASKYISSTHTKGLLDHDFEVFLSDMNIQNVNANFQEVLFIWGAADFISRKPDNVLECMAGCCEIFWKIVAGLKSMHY